LCFFVAKNYETEFRAMVIRDKFRQLLNVKPAGTPAGFK
jgi:hypothetical protein